MRLFIIVILVILLFSGCSGCSKSGRIRKQDNSHNSNTTFPQSSGETGTDTSSSVTVKMERINGIYQIPVEIDGVPMRFIFDTGASSISISDAEAYFLFKQGEISDEDILGNESFSDANGDVSEGTLINLRTVKIGSRTLHNIKASVVHNLKAPLLFGQTALEKFGKVSIDYQKAEITFE